MQILSWFKGCVKSRIFRVLALILPVVLVALSMSRNVRAKNTYVITDGDQVITYSSYATDPEDVLNEAGFALKDLDMYTTSQTDGISEITVQRSQQITIDNCGKPIVATSYGETVEQLLQRLEISSNGAYQVFVCVEANAKTVAKYISENEKVQQLISEEERAHIEYNRDQFRNTIEEELSK